MHGDIVSNVRENLHYLDMSIFNHILSGRLLWILIMYIPIWIIILVLFFIFPDLIIFGLILFALFWVLKWGLILLFGSGFLLFDCINKFLASTEGSTIIGFIVFLTFACYIVQCFNKKPINTMDENNQASNENIKNDDTDSQDSFFNKSIYKR